jgi:arylsulfatase A-like enzyme
MCTRRIGTALLAILTATVVSGFAAAADALRPNVLIITVDTLRADRMSGYGYERPTTPNLDRLMRSGVRFTQARTVEPLTGPALCSMLTAQFPHETGASRNGLRMHAGLPSLPKMLRDEGYRTAAIVSNWTLRDKITGLGEHFDEYVELLKRKRWLGLFSSETKGDKVTDFALEWLEDNAGDVRDEPFLLWVHYIDPHAPYKKQRSYLGALGLPTKGTIEPGERYDTEIAFADAQVARVLDRLEKLGLVDNTLIAFASDHGESLGEHDYWGHGRHLYEPTLRIPMSLVWPGRIEPRTIEAPALNIDLAPTIARLLGLEVPEEFRGYDWNGVLDGGEPPLDRATAHQAHRGAVFSKHDSDLARRAGLLEVGVVLHGMKEVLRIKKGRARWRFDLTADPAELANLAAPRSDPTEDLRLWMELVDSGLRRADEVPPRQLDDETIERLRALGYAD